MLLNLVVILSFLAELQIIRRFKFSFLSPVSLFFYGINIYFILPVIVGVNYSFFGSEPFDGWFYYFKSVDDYHVFLFLLFSFCAFLVFSFPFLILKFNNFAFNHTAKYLSSSGIYIIPVVLMSIYLWSLGRHIYFSGYTVDYDSDFMGKLATLEAILIFFFIFTENKHSKVIYGLIMLVNCILLLSMGGRMYVLLSLISLGSFFYGHRTISVHMFLNIIIAIVGLVLVGMWRLDGVKYEFFSYILLAEPMYTSYSIFSFIHNNEIPMIAVPINFINSFLMSMPSFLVDKTRCLISVENLGFSYDSPLGATSLFVSLIANFGVLGSFVFLMLFSLSICLSKNSDRIFLQSYYYISCGVIPFMLFRDAFGISIKVLFLTGFLIPFIISLIDFFVPKKEVAYYEG